MKPGISKVIASALLSLFSLCASAQTDADALRYSQSSVTGTARFSSMAGAFGALGGDFSSLATNPAGIGIYRSSEFTFSSSLYMNHNTSDFLGNTWSENRFNFNIPNFGFVFTLKTKSDKDKPGWKNFNFGIGLNRINSFQSNTYYEGYNPDNSMLDHFVEEANKDGIQDVNDLDPFYEGLAYDNLLIYHADSTDPFYTNDHLNFAPTAGIYQRRAGSTRGGISEWNFSGGANYNDMLYLGASLGFRSIRYIEESFYQEVDADTMIPYLNSFSLEQYIRTYGGGVNLKLGAIVRPADWVRIGVAFHTPTLYYMWDEYNNIMRSDLDGISTVPQQSPYGEFNYNLTTPLKFIGSLGFIIGKRALIGVDYEMIDYPDARFSAYGYGFSEVNNLIRQKYTAGDNLRVGGEYRLDNLSFRGGYALYGSPFSRNYKIPGADFSKTSYTGGIGFRENNYFVDLGYVYAISNEYFQPYTLSTEYVPGVKNKLVNHNFVVTFGMKF